MRFPYTFYDKPIGFYELNPLPGCNQVVVSNHAWIAPAYRGKGHGQDAHQQRLDKASELGYDYIVCTVQATNEAQRHILVKNGWKELDWFTNKETNHSVVVYGRKL